MATVNYTDYYAILQDEDCEFYDAYVNGNPAGPPCILCGDCAAYNSSCSDRYMQLWGTYWDPVTQLPIMVNGGGDVCVPVCDYCYAMYELSTNRYIDLGKKYFYFFSTSRGND